MYSPEIERPEQIPPLSQEKKLQRKTKIKTSTKTQEIRLTRY
jgi:hypothetical protein